MLIRCLGTFVCLLTFVPGAARADAAKDKNTEDQIVKMTQEVIAAEVRGDLPTLDRFFTDSYTHTHAVGKVESRAVFLGAPMPKYKAAEISQILVRPFGASALISGHEVINGDHHYSFTAFWVQEQGKWRLAAWVTSPFLNPNAPSGTH